MDSSGRREIAVFSKDWSVFPSKRSINFFDTRSSLEDEMERRGERGDGSASTDGGRWRNRPLGAYMLDSTMNGPIARAHDAHGAALVEGLDTRDAETLSVLLHRVKAELDALAGVVGDMQTGLTPLLGGRVSNEPEACRHAQKLDLVWQTLESLSRVLNDVAREGASHHPIDIHAIAGGLPLSDLSARLRGVDPAINDLGDDLDLF